MSDCVAKALSVTAFFMASSAFLVDLVYSLYRECHLRVDDPTDYVCLRYSACVNAHLTIYLRASRAVTVVV
jgi:hypothetical protein